MRLNTGEPLHPPQLKLNNQCELLVRFETTKSLTDTHWGNYDLYKNIWQYLIKRNICLFYDPSLGTYPTEMHANNHQKTCIRMSISTLFIIAQTRKLSKCSTIIEYSMVHRNGMKQHVFHIHNVK